MACEIGEEFGVDLAEVGAKFAQNSTKAIFNVVGQSPTFKCFL